MREVFLDTSYLIASINPDDARHEMAHEAVAVLSYVRFVTTDTVLTEFLGYFSGRPVHLRTAALALGDSPFPTSRP